MEYYLSYHNKQLRTLLSKLRLSDHKLMIELGRYRKIPRDQRLCVICNTLDDESHFLLECKINSNIRTVFLQNCCNINDFNKLNKTEDLHKSEPNYN